MTYNPKTVQVKFILDDEFYDGDDLADDGWRVVAEMIESVNGEFLGAEQ